MTPKGIQDSSFGPDVALFLLLIPGGARHAPDDVFGDNVALAAPALERELGKVEGDLQFAEPRNRFVVHFDKRALHFSFVHGKKPYPGPGGTFGKVVYLVAGNSTDAELLRHRLRPVCRHGTPRNRRTRPPG